jgi:hypothetical protein
MHYGVSKMRQLTLRFFIASCTFIIGISAFTLCTVKYFNKREKGYQSGELKPASPIEGNIPNNWQKVDMENKAFFYIPPSLESKIKNTNYLYRSFQNEDIDILAVYRRRDTNATCDMQNSKEIFPQSKWSKVTIDGKDATIGWVGKMPLDLESNTQFLDTVIVCVPNVGDGGYEFQMVAMYKNEQDYRDVQRVINSIRFSHP